MREEEFVDVGLDAIYAGYPKKARYPTFLYYSTMMITWGASGIVFISGITTAASPGYSP